MVVAVEADPVSRPLESRYWVFAPPPELGWVIADNSCEFRRAADDCFSAAGPTRGMAKLGERSGTAADPGVCASRCAA